MLRPNQAPIKKVDLAPHIKPELIKLIVLIWDALGARVPAFLFGAGLGPKFINM